MTMCVKVNSLNLYVMVYDGYFYDMSQGHWLNLLMCPGYYDNNDGC